MTIFIEAVIYLLLAILGYGLVKFAFRSKIPSNVPPGSMGWPLIGDTLSFLMARNSNYFSKYLQQRCSRYGLVFKCRPFGAPTIVSCDMELNSFILQNEGKIFSTSYPKQVQKTLGEQSILFVSGQLHKRLRSVVVSFVNTSQINPDFIPYLEKLSLETMESWKKDGRKEISSFLRETQLFTFYAILKRALDIDRGDENAANIQEDVFTIMEKRFSYIPKHKHAWSVKARARILSNLKKIISEKRKQIVVVKAELSEEDIVSGALSCLLGHETAAELLAVSVYFLANSPRAFQELREEHKSLRINKKKGEPLSLEDYKKMDFTLKVINETLRCGNVARYVFRKALTDVKYKGFVIPSGWQVIPFFTGTHLNPSLHENPSEFNPWRWDNEETRRKVTPFGGGIRICPGAEIAKLSVALFLHHFVLNFNWKIREDEGSISRPFMGFEREFLLEIEPAATE